MPPPLKQTITLPNGQSLDLFYIGTLAEALGRTSPTIRKWEIAGVIPDPLFSDSNGRRLYSREQINAIVACAEKAKIMQGRDTSSTSFSKHCYEELDKIRLKYQCKEVKKNA